MSTREINTLPTQPIAAKLLGLLSRKDTLAAVAIKIQSKIDSKCKTNVK
jgi:hypothetical protein